MGLYMCGEVLKAVPKTIRQGTKNESEAVILAVVDRFDDDPYKLPETDFVWDFDPVEDISKYPKELKMVPVQVAARLNKYDNTVNKSIVLVKNGKKPEEELRKILDSFGEGDDAEIFKSSASKKSEKRVFKTDTDDDSSDKSSTTKGVFSA